MTHASLFSGIGGPEVAAAMLGWRNAFHCEINPFGRAVLDYWFNESESYEDITKTDFTAWRGRIDVLTGGFPCQPFSFAGKRGGADDNRYLWPEMLRAIGEIQPRWVVGENVAGLATMVEGGVLTDMGSEGTLFGEVDGVHRYGLRQTFTIERICKDLEGLGYSVQPVLVPAAAVGAPHRRDRIFILAGVDEGEGGAQGLPQRHEVEHPGESGLLRPEGGSAPSHSHGEGREERMPAGEQEDRAEDGAELHDRTQRPRHDGDAADAESEQGHRLGSDPEPRGSGKAQLRRRDCETPAHSDLQRRDKPVAPEEPGRAKRLARKENIDWRDGGLRPERRWAGFPTVSPVHRGDDGLPFSMDDLSLPAGKWRTEALKAYGNAIVPQVMYRIFQCIEQLEQNETQNTMAAREH